MGIYGKFQRFLQSSVRKMDSYGKPITFTVNGSDTYNSFAGGCATICAFGVSFAYLIVLITQLFDRKFVTTSVGTTYRDMKSDPVYKISDSNFSIGIYVSGIPAEILQNDRYFSLVLLQQHTEYLDFGQSENTFYNMIPMVPCSESDTSLALFANDDYFINGSFWPKNTDDLYLQGVYKNTESYKRFFLMLTHCVNEDPDYWAPMEEIEAYNGGYVNIYMADSYFDSEDYEQPVKTYANNILWDFITIGYGKQYDVYLSPDKASTKDSAFSIFQTSTDYNFISHDFHEQYFETAYPQLIMLCGFYSSNRSQSYSRSTLSIIDILGIAGGFSSIVFMLFGKISEWLSQRLFYYNLNSKLYQVDASNYFKRENSQFADMAKVSPTIISIRRSTEESKDDLQKMTDKSEWKNLYRNGIAQSHHNKKTSDVAREKRIEVIDQSFQSMLARRMYNYSAKDVCYNMCWCCKRKPKEGDSKLTLYERYQLYLQGQEKVVQEFDALNYAKTQRLLKVLLDALMDKNERFLIEYQHINTIGKTSDLIDSNPAAQPPNLVKSSQEAILKHKEKLNKFMEEYTQEILTRKDFRLISNVFNNSKITEAELDKMEVVGDGLEHFEKADYSNDLKWPEPSIDEEIENKSSKIAKNEVSEKLSLQKLPAISPNKHKILFQE